MKPLVVGAALAMLSLPACADPLATYTQNVQKFYGSISLGQGGDDLPFVYLPNFNRSLGTLQSVQLGLSLSIDAGFVDQPPETPYPPPTVVKITFGLNLFGYSEFSFQNIVQTVVPQIEPSGIVAAQAGGRFDQQFLVPDPDAYEINCSNDFYCDNASFYLSPFVISSIDNAETQDSESILYDLSETFYYAPATDVPEPDAAGLLLVGCLGSIAFAKFRFRSC